MGQSKWGGNGGISNIYTGPIGIALNGGQGGPSSESDAATVYSSGGMGGTIHSEEQDREVQVQVVD